MRRGVSHGLEALPTAAHTFSPGRSPGPLSVFVRSWKQLPPELHDHIHDLLVIIAGYREISGLSLVSQAWCRCFRPGLFSELDLRSNEDCRTLYSILQPPLSAWLAGHVTALYFHINNSSNPLCMALLRLLPACRTVWHRFDRIKRCVSRSADLKSSLRNLTSLQLFRWGFRSFRTLLRVLADIPRLETIHFIDVKWSGDTPATIDAANSICSGSFGHVRKIYQDGCTDNMAVPAWILGAASTRHSFTRRRTPGPAVGAETWATINLIRMFLGSGNSISYSSFEVAEAAQGETELSLS
ncbi:uncharacterized protein PHACADRAFT_99942 [Phanerochaete carnosa HHB-10118-sp]|uniref:F-box domain-containing protein n=1 Tax=Phanerochaete carnosa (strain HHB-10118-sp) TaxID=650164 RepID=K5USY6_PHACS|nr:uncharacterized protein PHACADRAFT_99942 [Phanerochaete carnosa HHB-10118-sp]EKM53061.1 hypothetical protein PHACADRAFT_99942 [Phanerochaete carnosa HHB-10118-sp]